MQLHVLYLLCTCTVVLEPFAKEFHFFCWNYSPMKIGRAKIDLSSFSRVKTLILFNLVNKTVLSLTCTTVLLENQFLPQSRTYYSVIAPNKYTSRLHLEKYLLVFSIFKHNAITDQNTLIVVSFNS